MSKASMTATWQVAPVKVAESAAVWRLHVLAGWCSPGPEPEWVRRTLGGSFVFLGAYAEGQLIGMARAISDGVSDAYIQDVVVDPAWRGRGIGGSLVDAVRSSLLAQGIDWIGLIATPGHEKFYGELGFTAMTDHTPMLCQVES